MTIFTDPFAAIAPWEFRVPSGKSLSGIIAVDQAGISYGKFLAFRGTLTCDSQSHSGFLQRYGGVVGGPGSRDR